ncbi:MAG TPA: hypothetical protein VHO66_08730, partial [Ruminiclostridium sp.]|nr:hypothetical protein [Ruminiclostridium sp.]
MLRNTGTNPLKKISKKPKYKLMAASSLDLEISRSVKPTQMQISYRANEANLHSNGHSSAKEDGKGRISEIQARRTELEARRTTRAQAGPLEYKKSRKQRAMNTGTKRSETLRDDKSEHYNEPVRNVRVSSVDTYVH